MPTPRTHSPCRIAALAVLCLAPVLPAAAQNTVSAIAFHPAVPTWQDDVRVTVSGTHECAIHSGTAAVGGTPASPTVDVTLEGVCVAAPPGPIPFSVEVPLPELAPDVYRVRIGTPGEQLAEDELVVHDAGQFSLDLPAGATDDSPTTITVGAVAGCGFYSDGSVTPGVIRVEIDTNCPILPPPPVFTTQELSLGIVPAGEYEVLLFDTSFGFADSPDSALTRGHLRVYHADGCVPSATDLCLDDARFRVHVAWQGFHGGSGEGQAIPLGDRDDTGLFWFFDPANVELTVKVLDGCRTNGHYWVFVSSGSTVAYQIEVTDTLADRMRTYGKGSGSTPFLVSDTAAFLTCP